MKKLIFFTCLAVTLFFGVSSSAILFVHAEFKRFDKIEAELKRFDSIETDLSSVLKEVRLMSPQDLGNRRLDVRLFMIHSQLAQAKDPVVFIGDSITEAALLPSSICGHSVVNAGIGGTTVGIYADLTDKILNGEKLSLVVVALGTNDSSPTNNQNFSDQYRALLKSIRPRAERIALAGIPQLGAGPLTSYFVSDKITANTEAIRSIAEQNGFPFIDLATGASNTVDGVHLSPAGYDIWLPKMLNAARSALQCED